MNKFSVLDDSDDEETTPVVPQVKEKKAKKTAAVAEPAAPAPQAVAADKPNAKKGKDTPKEQNGKSKNTNDSSTAAPTNAPPKQSSKTVEKSAAEGDDDVEAPKDNNRGGHSRGKDSHQRGGRGGKPGRGAEGEGDETSRRPPKREYDRRSASGRGKEVHRGGRGPFGAGNVKQEAQDAEKDPLSAEPEIEVLDQAAPEVTEEPASPEPAAWTADGTWAPEAAEPQPEKEPEPVVFSLDEYAERQKDARSSLLAKVESRPERVVEASAYAGLVTVVKDELEDDRGAARNQRDKERKQQQLLDVSFKFQAPAADRDPRDRDGRKDGRGSGGGRGRGGGAGRGPGRGRAGGAGKATGGFSDNDFPAL